MIIFLSGQESVAVLCTVTEPQVAIVTRVATRVTAQGTQLSYKDDTGISTMSYVCTLKNLRPVERDRLQLVFEKFRAENVTVLLPEYMLHGHINVDSLDIVTIYQDIVAKVRPPSGGSVLMYERARTDQEQLYDASFRFLAAKRTHRDT